MDLQLRWLATINSVVVSNHGDVSDVLGRSINCRKYTETQNYVLFALCCIVSPLFRRALHVQFVYCDWAKLKCVRGSVNTLWVCLFNAILTILENVLFTFPFRLCKSGNSTILHIASRAREYIKYIYSWWITWSKILRVFLSKQFIFYLSWGFRWIACDCRLVLYAIIYALFAADLK